MDRIVSGITEYKKNKYKVCMDDGTHLVLYKGEVRRYRLQEGQTVDEALYQELFYEVVGKRVKKRALALLEKMDRTEQGLYRKLAESEYPEELILDAIEYVKKYHYIDDMRYARNYISYRQGSKSRRRLQQELMQKGVPKEITEQALEEIYENNDIEKIAEEKLIRKYKDTKKLEANILKVAHHGSKSSSIQQFLDEVKPEIALIGVGEKNTFGHPNDVVLERLENLRL